MERYPAFRVNPARVGKVRFIDNQRIAFPMTNAVSAIGRRYIRATRSSVNGADLETVVSFRQHDQKLRGLNDLPYSADVEETNIQSSERRVGATQRRIIFIGERFRLGCGRRRI